MIKFDSKNINDINFGDSNVIKVYRNGAVVYYKLSGESPTPEYQVCFAVVDDISQYQETEFEDVYDKATDKWYKLNNLSQYEEYGLYGSGKNITTYNGKLTIDDGYEYEWNGSAWANIGEVSGSSKTSDFTINDVGERITDSVSDGDYLLFSYYSANDISKPENIMSYTKSDNRLSNLSGYGITTIQSNTIIDPSIWVLEATASADTFYIKSIESNLYWGFQSKNSSISLQLVDASSSQKAPILITPSCEANCFGFVEKKSGANTGYGGYGLNQLNKHTYTLNWWNDGSSSTPCGFFTTDKNSDFIIYKISSSEAEYPKYYSDKADPLNNLVFNTMEEAQNYAYNNCVYDGMSAIIDGLRYYFNSTSENGWVESHDYSQDYFTMVVTSGGDIKWSGSTTANTLSYSKDNGETWNTADVNVTISVANGDKVLWKGTPTPQSNSGIGRFSGDTNVRYSVEGNAMSLLFGDDFRNQESLSGKNFAFYGLFYSNTNVTSAENMSLPATTLAERCYRYMFYGCTSLTTAPELPALNLTDRCYYGMFMGCTSLSSIKCLATDISESSCTDNWVSGVAASGTFTKAASMNDWTSGNNGIPNGWSVVDA